MSETQDIARAVDRFILKWGAALMGLMLAVALLGYGCGRYHRGEIEERIKHQAEGIKQQTKRADSIRTVYVKDTAAYAALYARWLALRSQIGNAPRHDEIPQPDTLRTAGLPPALAPVILLADSTINACTRALHDCDALQKAEHDRADSALALVETYKHLGSPWVVPYVEGLTELETGGYVLAGGVTLGHRLALTARGEVPIGGGPVRVMAGLRLTF